mmetsp:Transcript_4750/g.13447  ORF Transcript_4750/g.13447 Transcript_4750/m.13447 type:complete len:308 (-) Transcript_4750:84-1007(-)
MVLVRAIACLIFALSGSKLASAVSLISKAEPRTGLDVAPDPEGKMDTDPECNDIESGGPDWGDESLHAEDLARIVSECRQMQDNMSWRSVSSSVQFVHVGKCAGSSISMALHKQTPFHEIHIRQVDNCRPDEQRTWIVSVRDPLSRVVSAFNWRSPLNGDAPHGQSGFAQDKQEQQFYRCFREVNEFAESLQDQSECGSIARRALEKPIYSEHVGKGFYYYFEHDLECVLAQEVYLIRSETIAHDLNEVFGRLGFEAPAEIPHDKGEYPLQHKTYLSAKGKQLLQNALKSDYEVVRALEHAAKNGRR